MQVTDNERLRCELKRFGLRQVQDYNRDLLSKEQMQLIKTFRDNPDIIIRKADKSNTFVIMNKENYKQKLNQILSDEDKFQKVEKDPTPQLKKKLRSILETIHAKSSSIRFPMPVGQYQPGYIYGNAKIHKDSNNPPLRPIISQIGTPTYEIAKKLNDIISPYLPAKYMIQSTHEFIEITKTINSNGYLASLDVESLFTNVPVSDTINIIIDHMYNNPTNAPPDIPKVIMENLLKICTTQTPFRDLDGNIYQQTDGVSMGSPLGPLFANFYMCFIENNIIPTLNNSPIIYTRYVDDILLMIPNINTLREIKEKFESLSVLKFTYEIEEKKTIAFLDVKVARKNEALETSVYTKSTNSGECMNYLSIAPERYKVGVIRTFLHRAYNICSSWTAFHTEISRIRQLLTNNNFPMHVIETEIHKFLNRKYSQKTGNTDSDNTSDHITLYYKSQMTTHYKQEEANLIKIIDNNVKSTDEEKAVKLQIYYKSKQLRNLFIKNNQHKLEENKRSHVVYRYTCGQDGCQPSSSYIGYTECALVDRLRNHTQNGAILKHNIEKHNSRISTQEILNATKIVRNFSTKQDLTIAEALLIKEESPALNGQKEGEDRVLHIF